MKLRSSLHEVTRSFTLRSVMVLGMIAGVFAAHQAAAKVSSETDAFLRESMTEIDTVRHEVNVVESTLHWHGVCTGSPRDSLSETNSLEKEQKESFLKSVKDVYSRASNRYFQKKADLSKYPGLFEFSEFEQTLNNSETLFRYLEANDLVTPEGLAAIETEQLAIDTEKGNRVSTVEKLTKNIFEVYDPIQKNGLKLSQTCVVTPLTKTWFQTTPELQHYYDTTWVQLVSETNAGEVIGKTADPERFQKVLEAFAHLRSMNLPESPDKELLDSLDVEALSQKESLIFIDATCFDADMDREFSSFVSVKQQYGPISIHPLQTLLIHELNMAAETFLPDDTHMGEDDVKFAQELMKTQPEKLTPERLDDALASESFLALVNCAYIVKTLSQQERL